VKYGKCGRLGFEVDYSAIVPYENRAPEHSPCPKVNGVYLLHEDGRYYIGESCDVFARTNGHRLATQAYRISGMVNPDAVLLAEIKLSTEHYEPHERAKRRIAERRFIVAALRMGLTLTNKSLQHRTFRDKIQAQFSDVTAEMERLQFAIKKLC
jgi:hypothetical protein